MTKKVNALVAWAMIATLSIFTGFMTLQEKAAINTQRVDPIDIKLTSKKIIALGDMACPADEPPTAATCQFPNIANAIRQEAADAILMLGDLQYPNGAPEDFATAFDKQWGELKGITYASPGNHEYNTKNAAGYFKYWNAGNSTSKHAGDADKGYHSFEIGPWHILALNSNCKEIGGCDEASTQGQWLLQDLDKYDYKRCTLAFWHHPSYSSGHYYNVTDTLVRGEFFWKALSAGKADVVLNGHDHIYERFQPKSKDGKTLTQFTVGTGGRVLYKLADVPSPGSAFTYNQDFGYLVMNLWPNRYDWQYKTVNGQIIDSGKGQCSAS